MFVVLGGLVWVWVFEVDRLKEGCIRVLVWVVCVVVVLVLVLVVR